MDLTHRVRVPASLDEVWAAVNDPARIAVVLPGSSVDEAAGDTFSGTWKIKLGSSLLTLAGTGSYESRDEGDRRVVVRTDGADRRGDAGVEATHTLSLARADDGAGGTEVTVSSTMAWSGRPARLGAGVVADAVDRVLAQAQSRIAARVAEGLPWVPDATGTAATDGLAAAVLDHPVELGAELGAVDAGTPAGPGAPRPAPSPAPGPSPRPPEPREYVYRPYSNAAEPHVESARTLGRVVVRRVLPYAGIGALAVFAAASAVRRARR